MAMYLARLITDQQIVGFFHTENINSLFWMIDECCSPREVEIAEIGNGGIYWGQSIDFSVPIPDDEHGEPIHDQLPAKASLTEEWGAAIFGHTSLIWLPVPDFDSDD